MTYELHPLCTLFPRVTGAEFDALVQDIRANGLRQPIVLHNDMILDGGNRYRACLEAGIQPHFEHYEGESIVAFVLSANLHRRHLSAGQQAAIVASAQDWATAQTVGRPNSATLHDFSTAEKRAAESGASVRTQKMADKVAKASPDLAKKVAHGEVSLPKALAQVEKKTTKPAPAPEPVNHELEEAAQAIAELADENEKLRDRLAVEAMDASEEEKTEASHTINELRAKIKTLEAELDAVKASRDGFQRENAELKKQVQMHQRTIKKLESEDGATAF